MLYNALLKSVLLQWDSVVGASKYEVYNCGSQTGTFVLIGTPTVNRFQDIPLKKYYETVGTKIYVRIVPRYYKIKAYNSVGDGSDFSETIKVQ